MESLRSFDPCQELNRLRCVWVLRQLKISQFMILRAVAQLVWN